MSYVSLYRKYRSQSFGEVMGQQHITTVLQNAIRMGRISHAYLFCGPRGCGKTSTARLLARALNCLSSEGPTAEPCGTCSLCERIRNGSSMDIIEMDAASETGIDDVREKIIENAKFAPGEARFKVYIIDEVHDLSQKAFDSLLKTIEEPPAHVVFILATTEAHKVPVTVRSRCQRMDFRRGSLNDLMGNVRRVLEAEGIEHEPEAIAAIARAAEGSFRDSLSLLEQALAYTDGNLTAAAVHASIGTVGADVLDSVIETIASDDLHAAFGKAGELVETGKDVKQTLIALQLHLRDLLVASAAVSPQALPEVSQERFVQLKEQARRFTPQQLLQMLDVLADTERDLRFTNQHRLLLERALWSVLPGSLKASAPAAAPALPPPGPAVRPASRPATQPAAAPPALAAAADARAEPEPAVTPEPETSASAAARFAPEIDLEGIRRVWPRVIRRVTHAYKAAGAIFTDEVVVARFEGRFVEIGFPREFERSRADKPKAREALEHAIAGELGIQGLKVRCVLVEDEISAGPPLLGTVTTSMELVADGPSAPTKILAGVPPAAIDLRADEGNGSVSAEGAAPSAPVDEHSLFVELVSKELDCVPVED